MKKIISFIIPLCFISFLVFSYSTNSLKDQYKGAWVLVDSNDESIQTLIDMGMFLEFNIYTYDNYFRLKSVINGESIILNEGKLIQKDTYYQTVLPDQEYGGYIYGTLIIKNGQLHYSTGEEMDWIFERY